MKQFTPKERLQIYLKVKEKRKINGYIDMGGYDFLCNGISMAIKLITGNLYEQIDPSNWPELIKRKPDGSHIKKGWWSANTEGQSIREKCLDEMINELKTIVQ